MPRDKKVAFKFNCDINSLCRCKDKRNNLCSDLCSDLFSDLFIDNCCIYTYITPEFSILLNENSFKNPKITKKWLLTELKLYDKFKDTNAIKIVFGFELSNNSYVFCEKLK